MDDDFAGTTRNEAAIARARAVVASYAAAHDPGEPDGTVITDLLADLLHLAQYLYELGESDGKSPEDMIESAQMHVSAEQRGEL